MSQIGYSIVTMDAFVFLANCFGLLIGLYFSLVAYGYSTDKVREEQLRTNSLSSFCLV